MWRNSTKLKCSKFITLKYIYNKPSKKVKNRFGNFSDVLWRNLLTETFTEPILRFTEYFPCESFFQKGFVKLLSTEPTFCFRKMLKLRDLCIINVWQVPPRLWYKQFQFENKQNLTSMQIVYVYLKRKTKFSENLPSNSKIRVLLQIPKITYLLHCRGPDNTGLIIMLFTI